jgi:hypothetical protein
MNIIRSVGETLQRVLGTSLDDLAIQTRAIRRVRKFTGTTLAKTLVMTLMKTPEAKPSDYVATATRFGVFVTPEAIERRFSPALLAFLRASLERTLKEVVAARPVPTPLLQKFTSVRIGDSTTVALPDQFADEFPGCGGKSGSGRAALKIQALWDLTEGTLLKAVLEPGKNSDGKSVLMETSVPAGSLSIFDLGYFRLGRFRKLGDVGAYWISRFQQGTLAFHPDGRPLNLLEWARQRTGDGPIDMPILLGAAERLACRLILVRVPREIADRNRGKAYEKAAKHGRVPSQECLDWCDWTAYLTNCPAELLSWKEVVVLYRTRWQIELLFKLWKSHNRLGQHRSSKSAEWQMAELLAKLIGVILQHWLLLTSTWENTRRSLRKAAKVIRDWINDLIENWDDLDRLGGVLEKMRAAIQGQANVDYRGKHPSWFQLQANPELLDYKP